MSLLSLPGRADPAPTLSEDSERIVDVMIYDGTPLAESLIIYPYRNSWMLPLAGLSDVLGFNIQSLTDRGIARGYVLDPSREFELDTTRCVVHAAQKTSAYDCSYALVYQGDIYVDIALIELTLPVNLRVDSRRSRLEVTPREPLPIELRKERERKAEQMKALAGEYDYGYPRVRPPYSVFEAPFLDQQLAYTHRWSGPLQSDILSYNTNVTGEVLGLEALAVLAGDQAGPQHNWLTLARRDTDAGLFGPMKVREVKLVNVDLPPMPLISPTRLGLGFSLSTYPFNSPINFGFNDFRGQILPGWEVELYRNELLIDRQTNDGTGFYLFRRVPLLYGRNQFRFAFYGPRGEYREEYRSFNITPAMAKPGTTNYRLGVIHEKDRFTGVVQGEVSLLQSVTAVGGIHQEFLKNDFHAFLGVNTFIGNVLLTSLCAAAGNGGKACEAGFQTGFGSLIFGAKHSRLFNYRSDYFFTTSVRLLEQTEANLGYILPLGVNVGTQWEFRQRRFEGAPHPETLLTHRNYAPIGPFYLGNSISFDPRAVPALFGTTDVSYIPSHFRLRLGAEYDLHRLRRVESEVQTRIGEDYSVSAIFSYLLLSKTLAATIITSRLFQTSSISLTLGTAGARNYSAGFLATFSLARDPRLGDVHFSSQPQAAQGAASVSVFRDRNYNGLRDPGEEPLPKVAVLVNQQSRDLETDDKGIAFVPYLPPHLHTDLSLSLASIEDPYLRPLKSGVRFYPRAGKTFQADLPLVSTGEVDGIVSFVGRSEKFGRKHIRVQIVKNGSSTIEREVVTDSEGFFLIDNLPPGDYRLGLPSQLIRGHELVVGEGYDIHIPEDGSILSGRDFQLKLPD